MQDKEVTKVFCDMPYLKAFFAELDDEIAQSKGIIKENLEIKKRRLLSTAQELTWEDLEAVSYLNRIKKDNLSQILFYLETMLKAEK